MSEIESKGYEAPGALSFALAFVAAIVIAAVACTSFLNVLRPSWLLRPRCQQPLPSQRKIARLHRARWHQCRRMLQIGPAVYRCTVNGTTTYSDTPCPGAKVVDARPAAGVSCQRLLDARRLWLKQMPDRRYASDFRDGQREVEARRALRMDRKAIESIDVQARQGQTAVMQDRLREDRQKLVDERYALKC